MIEATAKFTIEIPVREVRREGIAIGTVRDQGATVRVEVSVSPLAGAAGIGKAKEFYELCENWIRANIDHDDGGG